MWTTTEITGSWEKLVHNVRVYLSVRLSVGLSSLAAASWLFKSHALYSDTIFVRILVCALYNTRRRAITDNYDVHLWRQSQASSVCAMIKDSATCFWPLRIDGSSMLVKRSLNDIKQVHVITLLMPIRRNYVITLTFRRHCVSSPCSFVCKAAATGGSQSIWTRIKPQLEAVYRFEQNSIDA